MGETIEDGFAGCMTAVAAVLAARLESARTALAHVAAADQLRADGRPVIVGPYVLPPPRAHTNTQSAMHQSAIGPSSKLKRQCCDTSASRVPQCRDVRARPCSCALAQLRWRAHASLRELA